MEPVIKVRYKEKLLVFCLLLGSVVGFMPRCDKTPQDQGGDKIPGDNGFSIHVSGSPRKYRPNQVYTIQLHVRILFWLSMSNDQTFIVNFGHVGFMICISISSQFFDFQIF